VGPEYLCPNQYKHNGFASTCIFTPQTSIQLLDVVFGGIFLSQHTDRAAGDLNLKKNKHFSLSIVQLPARAVEIVKFPINLGMNECFLSATPGEPDGAEKRPPQSETV
jgi:hypothetical protein